MSKKEPEPTFYNLDEINIADVDQAMRMPVLHKFFEHRTVAELLMDINWLTQYLIFRHYQETKNKSG